MITYSFLSHRLYISCSHNRNMGISIRGPIVWHLTKFSKWIVSFQKCLFPWRNTHISELHHFIRSKENGVRRNRRQWFQVDRCNRDPKWPLDHPMWDQKRENSILSTLGQFGLWPRLTRNSLKLIGIVTLKKYGMFWFWPMSKL